ncbi:MAG: oligoribonuclease [Myxococcota bacterium]
MPPSPKHLVWLDMEMSGLDPETCVPLEIATVVTDNDLNILAEGPNLVIHQPESVLDAMDDWNTEHHGASGLTEAVRNSRVSCQQAEEMTLSFLTGWTEPGRSPLCGNSVGQDRRFLRRYMPRLEQHLHYRIVDISSIKELSVRWYSLEPPRKKEAHRALDDILESIEELRFYRRTLFRTEPALLD